MNAKEKAKQVLDAAHTYLSNDALSLGWNDPFESQESLKIAVDAAGTSLEVIDRLPPFDGKEELMAELRTTKLDMLKELGE